MEPFLIGISICSGIFACLLGLAGIYRCINDCEHERTKSKYAEIQQFDMREII